MKPNSHASRSGAVALLSCILAPMACALPIPGIYNTGVDDTGALLPASAVDPHYELVQSPDAGSPGPSAYTLVAGFPVGPWMAEGPDSRWIAPAASQTVGSAPGD